MRPVGRHFACLAACRTQGFVARRSGKRVHFFAMLRRIVGLRNEKWRKKGPFSRRRGRIILSPTGCQVAKILQVVIFSEVFRHRDDPARNAGQSDTGHFR